MWSSVVENFVCVFTCKWRWFVLVFFSFQKTNLLFSFSKLFSSCGKQFQSTYSSSKVFLQSYCSFLVKMLLLSRQMLVHLFQLRDSDLMRQWAPPLSFGFYPLLLYCCQTWSPHLFAALERCWGLSAEFSSLVPELRALHFSVIILRVCPFHIAKNTGENRK